MANEKLNNLEGEVWTDDDDILLAEKVLKHVRDGKSVMYACREMEEETNGKRTASASKFRWHTRLKPQYQAGYELAKEEGKKKKKEEKRRINQGERYEDLVSNVLKKDEDRTVSIEDVYLLTKKLRDQENERETKYSKLERENTKLKENIKKLEKEMTKKDEELEYTQEVLKDRDKKYKRVLDSLQVLKEAGIQVNIPEQEEKKYSINPDGTVERL